MSLSKNKLTGIKSIDNLANAIQQTNEYFLNRSQKQVDTALTLRNWIIGCYIIEYEQEGNDRAAYGKKLYKEIADRILSLGIKSIRERHLYLCRDLYKAYPQILRSASAKSYLNDFNDSRILRTVSAKSMASSKPGPHIKQIDIDLLLNKLSSSHFIELLKADTSLKRNFYEVQVIKNNWSVRNLKRAMNSLLFERTGLSTDKETILNKINKEDELMPEDVFRNPYLLEFLGLEEKPSYSETDLEEAIINHLQNFLLELGRGFCFEARQKRITFDNTHYRIDLVFYHRILKCHILIDLKLEEFSHADAGQMNVYLNYFKENEMQNGDNTPIGIILCASKNETLVKYATSGLSEKVFVSKYMVNLPTEKELKKIIDEEQVKSFSR